ncbi:hypothetical protein E2C01_036816 [Portunus trituberculatus]|uniref:Uncharacterized protein n=1 Tax=Portunus trituberculatus TaxID=210409 RepID=A0A5B7FCE0_PORTR|nr:hypothetical protein [Portunus trituberculatus]
MQCAGPTYRSMGEVLDQGTEVRDTITLNIWTSLLPFSTLIVKRNRTLPVSPYTCTCTCTCSRTYACARARARARAYANTRVHTRIFSTNHRPLLLSSAPSPPITALLQARSFVSHPPNSTLHGRPCRLPLLGKQLFKRIFSGFACVSKCFRDSGYRRG